MKKILIIGGNSDIGLELLNNFLNYKNYLVHIHYNKKILHNKTTNKIKFIKKDLSKINDKNLNKYFDNNYYVIIN